jgi:aromatic amino acid aminotransferase I
LSIETTTRGCSSLKHAAAFLKTPGLISLGGGLPSSEYFPFEQLDIKVPKVGHFSEHEAFNNGDTIRCGKYDMVEDSSLFDISVACNYGHGHGAPQLLRWLVEHTEIIHNPPYQVCLLTPIIPALLGLT